MDEHPTTLLDIRVARVANAPVLFVGGEVDLASAEELAMALEPLEGRVVVDIAGVTFLDCAGIAALIAARNRLTADGGDIHLQGPRELPRRIFSIVGIDHLIIDRTTEAGCVAVP